MNDFNPDVFQVFCVTYARQHQKLWCVDRTSAQDDFSIGANRLLRRSDTSGSNPLEVNLSDQLISDDL